MTEYELKLIGTEVADLLKSGEYHKIVENYGYALCFGRDPFLAIKADFEKACHEVIGDVSVAKITVISKYFSKNETGIVALIECDFALEFSTGILIELILNSNEYLYIEDISSYRKDLNA